MIRLKMKKRAMREMRNTLRMSESLMMLNRYLIESKR